jgi:hypothetical protein
VLLLHEPVFAGARNVTPQSIGTLLVEVEQPAPVEAEPGGLTARFPGALRERLRPIAQRQIGGALSEKHSSNIGFALLRQPRGGSPNCPRGCSVNLGTAVGEPSFIT